MQIRWLALVPFALTLMGAEPAPDALSLEGSWTMDSAYEILANGTRTTNYGEHPSGLMIIDHAGRYSIQIFRRDRPPFKSGDKTRGTPEEYRTAVLGSDGSASIAQITSCCLTSNPPRSRTGKGSGKCGIMSFATGC